MLAIASAKSINLEESQMNSARLIKQAEQRSTRKPQPASAKQHNSQANAFTTVRNWIKEREIRNYVSPQTAFANLFTTGIASASVKVAG
jgi:hypothetical protein